MLQLLQMTKIIPVNTHTFSKILYLKHNASIAHYSLVFVVNVGSLPVKELDPVHSLLFLCYTVGGCCIHASALSFRLTPGLFFSYCSPQMEPKPTCFICCENSSRGHSLLFKITGLLITWDDTSWWFSHQLVLVAVCSNAWVPVKREHLNSCLRS